MPPPPPNTRSGCSLCFSLSLCLSPPRLVPFARYYIARAEHGERVTLVRGREKRPHRQQSYVYRWRTEANTPNSLQLA